MSWYEDEYIEPYIEEFNTNLNDKTWTTKKGETLFIFEMEDSHIVNTVRYLEREGHNIPYEMLRELSQRKLKV